MTRNCTCLNLFLNLLEVHIWISFRYTQWTMHNIKFPRAIEFQTFPQFLSPTEQVQTLILQLRPCAPKNFVHIYFSSSLFFFIISVSQSEKASTFRTFNPCFTLFNPYLIFLRDLISYLLKDFSD